MTRTFRLVPLRLSAGAVVRHNGFFAVDLERDATPGSALAKYLVDDLLYITTEDRATHIALGWTPDMDVRGKYHLIVRHGNGDAALAEYASRSCAAVAAQIERWLAALGKAAQLQCERLVPLRVVSGWHVDINTFTGNLADDADGDAPRRVLYLRKPYYAMEDIAIALDIPLGAQTYQLTITRAEDAAPLKTYQSAYSDAITAVLEQWVAVAHMLGGGDAMRLLAPDGEPLPIPPSP